MNHQFKPNQFKRSNSNSPTPPRLTKGPPLVAADSSASEPCTLLLRWISQVNRLHIDQTKRIPTAAVVKILELIWHLHPRKLRCWSQIMKVWKDDVHVQTGDFQVPIYVSFLGIQQKSLDVTKLWMSDFVLKRDGSQMKSGWWFQPIWKICSSNWLISPSRDENKKHLKPPTNNLSRETDRFPAW